MKNRISMSIMFFISLFFIGILFPLQSAYAAIATPPNFKVAFIGDSGAGSNQQAVLNLIKGENVNFVLHEGDFSYSDTSTNTWIGNINNILGTNFPYLGSDGNHDNWSLYEPFFENRLGIMGLDSNLNGSNYIREYNGLKMVFTQEGGNPSLIDTAFTGDDHIWKICNWHKNMNAMQIGGKTDEQGWPDYENCFKYGAIVATGHEHSYERTKTMTDVRNQIVDPSCSDRNNLCVSPGRSFVFVSGLGGVGIRDQNRCLPTTYPYGCKGEWASIYASDQSATYGALFITFHVDGNPNKARGYFKNINGEIIDQFEF